MKAIILLAGYATRMYPLTLDRPKALLPLGGRPVIDYIVDQINRIPEVDQIYAVTNHKFYTPFSEWQRSVVSSIPIEVIDDGTTTEDNRRGAIGDIYFTLNEKDIHEDIVVIAGDNYFTYDLREYYEFFKQSCHDAVCAGRINDREQLKQFAVATLDENGKLLSLIEKPSEPPTDIAVYATYFYKKETLPLFERYMSEGNKPDAPGYFVQWLYQIKDVYAYIMNGKCYDIGTIAAYEEMNAAMQATDTI